jgi:ferredoxin
MVTSTVSPPAISLSHTNLSLPVLEPGAVLDGEWLRNLCMKAGADDVGFVEIHRSELDMDRDDILKAAPWSRTAISFVIRMNRENIRSPMRSLANVEFHASDDQVTETSRNIVKVLTGHGVRAMHSAFGFPMETDRWPGKMWVVSHKKVAEAAGLGKMGIHRNLIHPQFGNFIFLGTVLIDRPVSGYGEQIDYNPCLGCKLCVAACPTGAIGADGHFDFSACYTHNYREFMGGFGDWVENVVESKSTRDYRKKVSDAETVSMWQSLSFESNYKAAYCLAVCPAGEDVIGPFLSDKKAFKQEVLKPLADKRETVYVVPGSDAEAYVTKRFGHKTVKHVGNGLRPNSIQGFLDGMGLTFNRGQSAGLEATYHFTFTGREQVKGTVIIKDKTLVVHEGHVGEPSLRIFADSRTWLRFLAKETNIVWALLRRKIRIKGSPKLLIAFGKCFPS